MAAASLPDELLARVLSPVDLKSLVQARAVCKSWQTSVEGKQVSDLRATTVTAEPLIALIGGCESNGFNPSTKISFRIGLDGPGMCGCGRQQSRDLPPSRLLPLFAGGKC